MTEKHFEEIRTRYGKWASWAVWDKKDITDTACIEKHIGSLRPGVIFIGLNASRDISQKDWLNFHTDHKADRNLRSLLNAAPWKGSYITDIFKDKNRITGNSKTVLDMVKKEPGAAKAAVKALKAEVALAGGKSPRVFILGLAAAEILARYAPEYVRTNCLIHPTDRIGNFFECSPAILKSWAKAESPQSP